MQALEGILLSFYNIGIQFKYTKVFFIYIKVLENPEIFYIYVMLEVPLNIESILFLFEK